MAKIVIATIDSLTMRNNTLDIRWTPAHAGVEGNEQAAATAKAAAEGREGRVESTYLREASLSHLTRRPPRRDQRPPAGGYGPARDEDGGTAPLRE